MCTPITGSRLIFMAADNSATSSTINLAMRSSVTGRVEGRSRGVAGGAIGGTIVANALDTPPDPTTEPIEARSAAQRRADALVDLAAGTTEAATEDREPVEDPADQQADPVPGDRDPSAPTGAARPTGRRTTSLTLDALIDIATLENRPGLDLRQHLDPHPTPTNTPPFREIPTSTRLDHGPHP